MTTNTETKPTIASQIGSALAANIITGLLAILFVAHQRKRRLWCQLDDLAKLVEDTPERDLQAILAGQSDGSATWRAALADIQIDAAKMPDRFVRLNHATQTRLDALLSGQPQDMIAKLAAKLNGADVHVPTFKEHYLRNIRELREAVSIRSFF